MIIIVPSRVNRYYNQTVARLRPISLCLYFRYGTCHQQGKPYPKALKTCIYTILCVHIGM